MAFRNLTNSGKEYLATRLANELPVKFIKAKIGNGSVPLLTNPANTTDLYNFKKQVTILNAVQEQNSIKLTLQITNDCINEGFYLKEIGIYVDDNGKEVLYWYCNEDNSQYINAQSDIPIVFEIDIMMEVTNINSTIVEWTGKDTWISKTHFDEKVRTFEIPTVIELQSRKNLKVGDIVEVLGYHSAGDGAGHKRIIANEDDGSGVQLANKLWANIIHNGEVNVSWFGFVSSTPLENTNKIQNIFNYINKNNIHKVNFCNFGEIILDVVTNITGSGFNSDGGSIELNGEYDLDLKGTVLKVNPNNSFRYSVIVLRNYTGTVSNCKIIGDRDEHDYSPQIKKTHEFGYGIEVIDSECVNIINAVIEKTTGDCIFISQRDKYIDSGFTTNNVIIKNCILDGARRNNISIECGSNILIENNIIKNAGAILGTAPKLGIDIEAYREVTQEGVLIEYKRVENVIIRNNKFINNIIGAVNAFTCYNVLIENNYSDTSITIHAGSFTKVIGNTLVKNNVDNNDTAFNTNFLAASPRPNQIKGSETSQYNIISKNTVIGFKSFLNGSWTKAKITDNFINTKVIGTINGFAYDVDFSNNTFKKREIEEIDTEPTYNLDLYLKGGNNCISNNNFGKTAKLNGFAEFRIGLENCSLDFSNNIFEKDSNNKTNILLYKNLNSDLVIKNNNLTSISFECVPTKRVVIKGNLFERINTRDYGILGGVSNFDIFENTFINTIINNGNEKFHPTEGQSFIYNNKFTNGNITNRDTSQIFKVYNNYFDKNCSLTFNDSQSSVINNVFENKIVISGSAVKKIGNISEVEMVSQLNTIYHLEKMKQENVYDDYISYMDEKTTYDKQQRKFEQDRQLAYEQALKENPNLSYEEFMSVQPMTLNLIEEPQPSQALKQFIEKYL